MERWGVYDVSTAYELGVEYPDQSGETALFKDIWRFERVMREDWWGRIHDTTVGWLIQTTRRTHGDGIAAYIAFMAQRLFEVRRVLKTTGSVYLHCDHEANAYLRQLMDAVFGWRNFRNEIIWTYTGPANAKRWFPRKHDTILFYAKDDKQSVFNRDAVRVPYDSETIARRGRVEGENSIISSSAETQERRGDSEVEKRFGSGKVPESWWRDIPALTNQVERTGYPTQKPQALARRMILASSNPGDLVLDCFAGCAYVPVAAEETGRRWIACDMSPRAFTVVRRQFAKKPELGMTVEGEEYEYNEANPRFEGKGVLRVRGPNDLPSRTDGGDQKTFELAAVPIPEIRFRQTPLEKSEVIWQAFVDEWGTDCWYCGRPRDANRLELHLDHIEPNKGDGTNDDCWNRALACVQCNHEKSDKLNPSETMDKALEAGRIQTRARREEIGAAFSVRREWAWERYESLPRKRENSKDCPPA